MFHGLQDPGASQAAPSSLQLVLPSLKAEKKERQHASHVKAERLDASQQFQIIRQQKLAQQLVACSSDVGLFLFPVCLFDAS